MVDLIEKITGTKDKKKKKIKGFATPILVRKPDGQNTTVLVDIDTGKEVSPNDSNYEVIDQYEASLIEMGLAPDPRKESESKLKTDAKTKTEKRLLYGNDVGSSGRIPGMGEGGSFSRTASNNYGYVEKPKALSLLGMVPDPRAAMVSKAIDMGINANNRVAINEVRDMLGLENKTGVRGLLDYTKDVNGYVGDVSYNGVTSPVGLEAEDKLGRTTLTPNEARMRKELSQNFREAEPIEKTQTVAQFQSENPQNLGKSLSKSLAGTVAKGAITGALSGNIMGGVLGSLVNGVKSYGMNKAKDFIGDTVSNALAEPHEVSRKAIFGDEEPKTRGRGLADLSPTANEGINYTHPERGPVTEGLSDRTIDVLNSLAGSSGSGITVTSAHRDRATNKRIGGAKNSMHITGDAFDLSTKNLSDQEKRDLVERAVMSGAMEIGTYPDQSLHIASRQRMAPVMTINGEQIVQPTGGVAAMHSRSRNNYPNAPDWFKDGLEVSRLAPTPTARPEYETPMGVSAFGGEGTVDLERSNQFTDADKKSMAMTLAGEVDPRYTDLSTDLGRREAFGIMSTMENRANKYGSVEAAINAPRQYSTWNNAQAAATAQANYEANPGLYDSLVDEYISNPANNAGFTSYYNPSIANPGWGSSMVQTEEIGPHRFGSLPEYSSFGQNFGQTGISKVTQDTITQDKISGVGVGVSATTTLDGSGWGTPSVSQKTQDLAGFSSSVSGENANRSTGVGPTGTRDQGTSFGSSSREVGSSGGFSSSRTQGTSLGSSSSGSTSFSSSRDSYSSKDSGLGGTSATKTRDTYNNSKDSGFGGTSSTSSSPDNKGDSRTSSGRLGGRV